MTLLQNFNIHYDKSLDYGITMYDHLPYRRNYDYCNSDHITMKSGKIIKYYMCKNEDSTYSIDTHDDQVEQMIQQLQYEKAQREQLSQVETETEEEEDSVQSITQEQLDSLVTDQDQDTPDPDTINLDEVEEW